MDDWNEASDPADCDEEELPDGGPNVDGAAVLVLLLSVWATPELL